MTLTRIIAALTASGFDASAFDACSMVYFDGIEHKETCEAVKVYTETPHTLREFMRRRPLYSCEMRAIMPDGLTVFHIMRKDDKTRIDAATATAAKFQTAFWIAIHKGKTQAEAVEAGKRAIA